MAHVESMVAGGGGGVDSDGVMSHACSACCPCIFAACTHQDQLVLGINAVLS